MAVQLAVSFSSLFVEYQYLVAFYQRRFYFANYLCTFYGGRTYCDGSVFVNQKNFVKLYCRTTFCSFHVVNEQLFTGFCLKLPALDFYNCVHFFIM